MAIPAILKGDDSGDVTITLADGHNYEGATLVVVFNGVTREFANLTAGGEVSLAFTADETAGMPLGTGLVLMRLIGPTGAVETVGNADARIKVTDCVAEVNAGDSFAVTPGVSPLADVEGLGTRYTGDQLRAKINEVIAKLGGAVAALLLCALPCLGGALDVQTAPFGTVYSDAPVVTNVNLDVHALTNGWKFGSDVDLTAATNYTDSALGAFASTGEVMRATAYGTPTRWTDATGCVWEVILGVWVANNIGLPDGESVEWQGPSWNTTTEEYYYDRVGWFVTSSDLTPEYLGNDENAVTLELDWGRYDEIHGYYNVHTVFTRSLATNLVGRVALKNDIPDVSGYATPADVTAAIREQSLGGIYDSELGVWWTPIMENGALRYETNAVRNAADALAAVSNVVAELAEYGSYGTVGAALLALIAGLAALKRRVGTAETALAGKMPMYPMVAVTPSSGTLTVTPYTVATYTADTSAVAFTVAVGTGTAGTARDCELVIDCTATGAVAPTVTWPATFHPRTDAATDFACKAGVRNIYFISEYAAGEFAVGGWKETAGGNV